MTRERRGAHLLFGQQQLVTPHFLTINKITYRKYIKVAGPVPDDF